MDKIEVIDCLDDVSNNVQGIISLANMRLNDLNNPIGSFHTIFCNTVTFMPIQRH